MAVILIGTLDTKGGEIAWVRNHLQDADIKVVVVDAGCLGEASCDAEISRAEVFQAAGTNLEAVQRRQDRGYAVTTAATGVSRLVAEAYAAGAVDGVVALGGSAGTTIGTAAMRALPLGVPKLMVSTLASGQTRPYVGGRDILMLNSVADIAGINRISCLVLSQAVGAMIGMLKHRPRHLKSADSERQVIAATMFGVTTPCVLHAQKLLEAAGYEVLVFHATGTGGEAMEGLIRDGLIAGVLDITTTELADELVGGTLSAGPERLTAAGQMGIPQVISVGATDMVNFGPKETVPEEFRDRLFYEHNATVTLMRTTVEENEQLGAEIGRKASAARGPVCVMFPSLAVSAIDGDAQPFDDWPARMALWAALRSSCGENVELITRQEKINDPTFATAAANRLLDLMKRKYTQNESLQT